MPDILIRGVEMSKDWDLWLCIDTDGTVYNVKPVITGTAQEVGTAIPLPEGHGRLIDADALREDWLENGENEHVYDTNAMLYSIDNSPTIVPAEGGGEDG